MLLGSCSQMDKRQTDLTSSVPSTRMDPTHMPSSSRITGTPPPSLSATMSPRVQPTMTYVPRLPERDLEAVVLKKLSDNGGCRLPCFWGLTPGETEVQTFLSARHAWGGSSISLPRDGTWLEISMIEGSPNPGSETLRRLEVSMIAYRETETQKKRVYDTSFYTQVFEYYTLPRLLATYGPPTDAYILLDLGIEGMGLGIDLFLLALDYTENGWVTVLEMPLIWEDETRQVAMGCPTQAFTRLQLWSPDDSEMAREYGYADGHGLALSIRESSTMTMEAFYDQFADSANSTCLEVPMDEYEE